MLLVLLAWLALLLLLLLVLLVLLVLLIPLCARGCHNGHSWHVKLDCGTFVLHQKNTSCSITQASLQEQCKRSLAL